MTLADKIVVLRDGEVDQVGTPLELYDDPDNLFVAGFIGSPKMNFLQGVVEDRGGELSVACPTMATRSVAMPAPKARRRPARRSPSASVPSISARAARASLDLTVEMIEHLGGETFAYARHGNGELLTVATHNDRQSDRRPEAGGAVRSRPRADVRHRRKAHPLAGTIVTKRLWDPRKSTLGRIPNNLVVVHEQPGIMPCAHWHAQVEVNFVFRGAVEYRMHGHSMRLTAGDLCLFWGGLPHQMVDTSEDAFFVAIHLPLVQFFRLRLPPAVTHKLTHGATLVTAEPDSTDQSQFDRWSTYMRSDEPARREHAIDELLLRIDRMQFEPYRLIEPMGMSEA